MTRSLQVSLRLRNYLRRWWKNPVPFVESDRFDDSAFDVIGILRKLSFGNVPALRLIDNERAGVVGKRPGFEQFAGVIQRFQILAVDRAGREPPLGVIGESNV